MAHNILDYDARLEWEIEEREEKEAVDSASMERRIEEDHITQHEINTEVEDRMPERNQDRAELELYIKERLYKNEISSIAAGFKSLLSKTDNHRGSLPKINRGSIHRVTGLDIPEVTASKSSTQKPVAKITKDGGRGDPIMSRWKTKASKLSHERFEKYPHVTLKAISQAGGGGKSVQVQRRVINNQSDNKLLLHEDMSEVRENDNQIIRGSIVDISTLASNRIALEKYVEKCHELGLVPLGSITDNSKASKLTLSNLSLKPLHVQAITTYLLHNPMIDRVTISGNHFTALHWQPLVQLFKERSAVMKSLNLSSNHLGDTATEALAFRLIRFPGLQELILSDNDIGNKGAEQIAEVLNQNETITSVNICHNNIGKKHIFIV